MGKYERKIELWEKKLFDLTLRNALLSARMTSSVIPFEIRAGELPAFMEVLRAGTSFTVYPFEGAAEPAESAALMESVEPLESVEPMRSVAPMESVESMESVQPIKPLQPMESAEPDQPSESPEHIESGESMISAGSPVSETERGDFTGEDTGDISENGTGGFTGEDTGDISEASREDSAAEDTEKMFEDDKNVFSLPESVSDGLLGTEGTPRSISLRLKKMSRVARSSVEETGSANLYWGIGLLRWFDKKTPGQERFAPLLLMPAEIVRGQGEIPYKLRAADEEPLVNQTLLEKLRLDYALEDSDRSNMLQDGDDFDLKAVLDRFRALIAPMQDWEIVEKPCLGIFSYAKYMMWEDLHEHREEILDSPIVRSLAGGTIEWKEDMGTWQEECREHEILAPVSLDSSQRLAVRAAAAGKSFVLHGPPGTGKSQTITAIIANALAQGQTVLFVAEKMAALSVVQNRLEELGLDDFCLEIHSRKSRKKDVIEKLRRAAEAHMKPEASSYEEIKNGLETKIEDAQKYLLHLHRKGSADLSVWELMDLYERFPGNVPEVSAGTQYGAEAALLTRQDLSQRREALEKLVAAGRAVGHPCGHPLAPVGKTVYTQEFRVKMDEQISTYLQAVDLLDKALDAYAKKTGEAKPAGIADLQKAIDINNELDRWNRLPMLWAQAPAPELMVKLQKADTAAKHYQSLMMCRDRLLKVFTPDILQLAEEEANRLRGSYDKARKSWTIPQYFGKRRLEAELSEFSADGQKVGRRRLGQYTQDIQNYQREYRLYQEAMQACGADLDAFRDAEGNLVIPVMYQAIQAAVQSTKRLQALTGSDKVRLERAGRPYLRDEIIRLKAASEQLRKQESDLKAFLECRDTEEMRTREQKDWFDAQRQFCSFLRENRSQLREWMLFNLARKEAADLGLEKQIEAYCAGMSHEDVIPSWQKTWTRAVLREMIEKDPVLNEFSGIILEEQISAIRNLDSELTRLAREEIRMRLGANVPEFVEEASENPLLSTFRKIILGGGKGMSIRDILTITAPVLPRLCPCMLMSPVSAAQYLAPERPPFDLVVFDEASQITTANAAGVLARGKNAVIVGDPNQMPPTNFFERELDLTEDPLEDDLASILEDCIAINLPQLYLSWHYRSRHESLISFSNERFYDGRLLTFPSADDGVRKVTLTYVGGQFESGSRRINRAEAEAVIAELKRRSRTPEISGQSVGIVTFNIQQQSLIEDLYDEAKRQDEILAQWDEQAEEALFIKNLENVQGDERDVILFSTTFGHSPEGRMSMNFGPLNREGGWKRLNVAITRARAGMNVFTSIQPEKDGLSASLSTGVRMLDAFLRYAAGQAEDVSGDKTAAENKSVPAYEESVCDYSMEEKIPAERQEEDASARATEEDDSVHGQENDPVRGQEDNSAQGLEGGSAQAQAEDVSADTAGGDRLAETYVDSLRLSMAGAWLRRQDDGVSGIAMQISRALAARGCDSVCGIGRSSFRVDVGITDPGKPEQYILGILLDGDHLESDKTFSDLEIGRKKVLEGLGWNLMSVRAIDWYDNPEKVLDQVFRRIQEIV